MGPIYRLLLVIGLISLLYSCSLNDFIDPVDYPPSDKSLLKGPAAGTLPSTDFALTALATLPFPGELRRSNTHYLLSYYQGLTMQFARVLPDSNSSVLLGEKSLTDVFIDSAGTAWGIAYNANQPYSLFRSEQGTWTPYATLPPMGFHYETLGASPTEFRFATSTGLIIYDVQQKKIRRQITTSKGQIFLADYSLAVNGRTLTLYNADGTTALNSIDLTPYIDTKKGISNALWGAYQDAQKRIWLVVKDGDWDGVLLRLDAKGLQKLALIPYDTFDSGRSARLSAVDKKGNLWVQVDDKYYVYTAAGQWVLPSFAASANNRSVQVLQDAAHNLLVADGKKLYAINL
jgi:hypothetical protein